MKELTRDLEKNERLSFPVTFELKVIMDATIPDPVNMKNIEMILTGLNIPFRSLRNRLSQMGKYMSFTYEVTITDYLMLKGMYEQMRSLPGLKFAV